MNRLIYYKWGSNSDDIMIHNLIRHGYDLTIIEATCSDYTRDMKLAQKFILKINEVNAEAVFSFDYFPILSMVCDTCKIQYYSWVYDSPHFTLYSKCTDMVCNHIGIFDRGLTNSLREIGIDTVYHVPLAADSEIFRSSIRTCKKDYTCDVSFVGSLYTDNHEYYGLFRKEQTDNNTDSDITCIWEKLDDTIRLQAFDYESDHISSLVSETPQIMEYLYGLMEEHGLTLGDDYIQDHARLVYDSVLAKRVTVIERRDLLEEIDRFCRGQNYSFRLFTGSVLTPGDSLMHAAKRGGYVDYIKQMPAVFAQSRINLNISLRTIKTGIPLRAIDILACGGFLLTNPQEEMYEYLTEGKDFEAFRSVEECLDKIKYYLEHDDERANIAASGYDKAEKWFSYDALFDKLVSVPSLR